MKYSQYIAATLPKIIGTRNLYAYACSLSSLDLFVLLSSGVGIYGSRSQGNYAAGNTFQDAFAAYRTRQNLPATVIDLGVVLELRLIDRQAANPLEGVSSDIRQLQTVLADVASLAAAADLVRDALAAKLAKSLMIPVKDLDTGKSVSTFGVDSLVAVEVSHWSSRKCKADVLSFDVLNNVPLTALAGKIAAKSKLIPAAMLEGESL
ncbi:MAG: hypothetical protein Q9161_006804 [Pseudevernia consocians]